eukprot:8016829-Pyramimonas_sp.AAC.1
MAQRRLLGLLELQRVVQKHDHRARRRVQNLTNLQMDNRQALDAVAALFRLRELQEVLERRTVLQHCRRLAAHAAGVLRAGNR